MSFTSDFFGSVFANGFTNLLGGLFRKTAAHATAEAVNTAGKSVGDGLVRGLAGSADTVGILLRRALQSDESAKDALNRCIVRMSSKDKRLKLARFFKTLDDEMFARVARNIDDLFADALSDVGKARAYQEDDPRIIFLNDFADIDESEMRSYLEALRFDEEPTARTKFKGAMAALKKHNDEFARRHNL